MYLLIGFGHCFLAYSIALSDCDSDCIQEAPILVILSDRFICFSDYENAFTRTVIVIIF